MKKFKELKQRLLENTENTEGGALGAWPTQNATRSAYSDFGVHQIGRAHV